MFIADAKSFFKTFISFFDLVYNSVILNKPNNARPTSTGNEI